MVGTRGRVAIPETTTGEIGVTAEGVSLSGGGGHVAHRLLYYGAGPGSGQGDVSSSLHDRSTPLGNVFETFGQTGGANAYACGEVAEQRYRGCIVALRTTAIMSIK